MPSYKLIYFDIRGLAENARLIFAAAQVPYEDVRLSFSFGTPGDFSTIKRPEFDAMKAEGKLDKSLGKVPLLEVDGQQIGQSKAIERFLAKEFGMMLASMLRGCFQLPSKSCSLGQISSRSEDSDSVVSA